MSSRKVFIRYRHKKSTLLNPINDDQQMLLNELIDEACNVRMNLAPTDPRSIPYLLPALWLWK